MTERSDPELSAALRAEYRAERREDERLAVRDAWRRRRLVDVAAEAMRRGDPVTMLLPGRTVTGSVAAVGDDYAMVNTVGGAVAVHLPSGAAAPLLQVNARARSGGVQQPKAPKTFMAVLRSYQTDQDLDRRRRRVELGTPTQLGGLVGHIEAVAVDHVYIRDHHGVDSYIPTAAVSYLAWADHVE